MRGRVPAVRTGEVHDDKWRVSRVLRVGDDDPGLLPSAGREEDARCKGLVAEGWWALWQRPLWAGDRQLPCRPVGRRATAAGVDAGTAG